MKKARAATTKKARTMKRVKAKRTMKRVKAKRTMKHVQHAKKVNTMAARCNRYHLGWLEQRINTLELAVSELHAAIDRLDR